MAKVVVYILSATAFIFFITQSPFNLDERKGDVGLNRRFGYNIRERAPSFDPLVAQMEREADKIGLLDPNDLSNNISTNTTLLSEVVQTYQYLTAGGKLNTTLRLTILFPLIDRGPKDGGVSFNELKAWNTQQSVDRLDYMTQIELESKDKDGDLAISFREYLPRFSEKDIEKKEMGHGEAGWWHEPFATADNDQNGLLNFTELRDFLHPEDSNNEEVLKWLLKDRLKRMDDDNDGKLNFKEFQDHVYNTYHSYVEFETGGKDVPGPHQKFVELDVNKDLVLSVEELVPILHYLYPGELSYAKYYTIYLMNQADDNEDGKLSLEEMINHEFIFYNAVHGDDHQDSGDDHDEL